MTRPKEYDHVVPLHLIPVTIAQRIRERGGNLYRISIVRTHQHHYTVKCKCRAKIAMEPLEDITNRSPAPGPGLLSESSDPMQGPGQLTAPFGRNQTDRIMSRARELIADFPRKNPEPEPLSGEPGTVVMAMDQKNGFNSQESELIADFSGKDSGPITVPCLWTGTGLLPVQSGRAGIMNDLTDRSTSPVSESCTSSSVRNPGPVPGIGPCDRNPGSESISGQPRLVVDND